MSADLDSTEKLLAAAMLSMNRSMCIVYVAESRILIAREAERLRQQALLFDSLEAEIVRTAPEAQK